MAAGKFKVYDFAKKYIGDGTIDLDETTNWKAALFQSTSNCDTLSIGTGVYGDLTNEVANGNGYTTGGNAIAGITWTRSGGTITFDCTDPAWTGSGVGFVARFLVFYKNATVNSIVKPLLCVCLLDTTPGDITISNGVTTTFTINASGVFTLSGADVN